MMILMMGISRLVMLTDGSEQQGPPDHGAAQKRVHLMKIVTAH